MMHSIEIPDVELLNEWGWHTYGIGTEVELSSLLWALVRVLKPKLVVETGCFMGYMSYLIGLACQQNDNNSKLITCDIDSERVKITEERCKGLPVEVRNSKSIDLPELRECDMLFSDADTQERPKEIELVRSGTLVVLHDTLLDKNLMDFATRFGNRLCFTTHRGFAIIQK